jgi:hypothetical protein
MASSSSRHDRVRRGLAARATRGALRKCAGLSLHQPVDLGRQRGKRGRETFQVGRGETTPGSVRRRSGFEQLADRHLERPREMDQFFGAGIHLRELDPSEVLVVQAGKLREAFLYEVPFEAQTAYLRAERAEQSQPSRRFSSR